MCWTSELNFLFAKIQDFVDIDETNVATAGGTMQWKDILIRMGPVHHLVQTGHILVEFSL